MELWQIVASTFGPALAIAFLVPRNRLVAGLGGLTLLGLVAIVVFLSTQVFDCGGEICLTNFIAAMFCAAAMILGDLILLARWLFVRRPKAPRRFE